MRSFFVSLSDTIKVTDKHCRRGNLGGMFRIPPCSASTSHTCACPNWVFWPTATAIFHGAPMAKLEAVARKHPFRTRSRIHYSKGLGVYRLILYHGVPKCDFRSVRLLTIEPTRLTLHQTATPKSQFNQPLEQN